MKPQKKAAVARKAASVTTPATAKKRRASPEKIPTDSKRDKKSEEKRSKRADVGCQPRKHDKQEEPHKKVERGEERKKIDKTEDEKRAEKAEDKKKPEEKLEEQRKLEEKKRIEKPDEKRKLEKPDSKRKQSKDRDRKLDKTDDRKKADRNEERGEESRSEANDSSGRKKILKAEEKNRGERAQTDGKNRVEKIDEKKKIGKVNEENTEDSAKSLIQVEEIEKVEGKIEAVETIGKKKVKADGKKEPKVTKAEKNVMNKEKKVQRKKRPLKDAGRKLSPVRTKKETKAKQSLRKSTVKKTVLVKKIAARLPVTKKLIGKKIKLVKKLKNGDGAGAKRLKKKKPATKNKIGDKTPKLAKQMKAKVPRKYKKMNKTLQKDEKLKKVTEKVAAKKKIVASNKEEAPNEVDNITSRGKSAEDQEDKNIKIEQKEEGKEEDKIKGEISQVKPSEPKKADKTPAKPKVVKKILKKSSKTPKVAKDDNDQKSTTSEDVTLDELLKQSKISDDCCKSTANSKQEENTLAKVDLKEENKSPIPMTSDAEDEEEQDAPKKTKRKILKKKDRKSPSSDERARRIRLFGFWSGPKRHRVASLNALAKVHCLYENEAGGVYLGGFCKPKPDKEKHKKNKEDKEDDKEKKEIATKKADVKTEENPSHRQLRTVPGLRGKHWDMIESSSTCSSSADEAREKEKVVEPGKKKITKRRKKKEEVMDLKDMVVSKRMASLNATAMLAASYSDEKNREGSSSIDSSSESEVEIVKRRKQTESDAEKRKVARQGSDPEEAIKSPKKVVIVNQDDVTITGVYVNQTRSTHHEGFCSIAGMQYRISSTSHTQTAATAVATEIHDQPKPEQPCKSYTPLGALSSMQPPGSQGPPHPPVSPRRHSAFSAPHQHGYYQPAGPLIQHPPTLPPVKGPPPEPTPTPPQNSEGSDDLVATSTTSGGTTSGGAGGGGFYRAYCPPYYGTPPQYQELCYPPTYSHPHHPPPYYKYAPTYRRQYYGYQESGVPGGGGPGGGGAGNGPGVVDYQPPPPPAEYPPPPYYGGYPPPPPPPPPPNPAYMHPQGRPFVDHAAFQGCPCPMQSCPKNVDTGPLIGNGKGAPVASGPGLSLPPSALVGPPSPARGLAGLAPPHGANAWDTDRVQINTHRNLTQNQPPPQKSHEPNTVYNRSQGSDCRTKDEKNCQGDKLRKCSCQKQAGTSRCEVKTEALSPSEKLSAPSCPSSKLRDFKLENNNVKCESCSVEVSENLSCAANCNVKCESGYKCEILKCEQCMKEGQIGILEIDKDSGILLIDEKLDGEGVKEELNDVVVIENENWKKPDYEPTVQENVEEKEDSGEKISAEGQPKCQKVTKRKLSLDSLSDGKKKRKVNKRTLSVGSVRDLSSSDTSTKLTVPNETTERSMENVPETMIVAKKKQTKKEVQCQKRKAESASSCELLAKKSKSSKPLSDSNGQCGKQNASETSIMETINSVIQQSVEMTEKKQRKTKSVELTEKKKKKGVNLLSTIKKVSKKFDSVKAMVSQKLNVAKQTEAKDSYLMAKSDAVKVRISEPKLKAQEAKSKVKVKNKILEAKSKAQEVKPKVQEAKSKVEMCRSETVSKAKLSEVIGNMLSCGDVKKPAIVKNRRKSTKKVVNKKISGKPEDSMVVEANLELIRKPCLKPKWSNGWSWEGQPYETKVYLTNEESSIRRCYASMRHVSGDVLRPRDCVLLKSGPRKADLPFVAKIAALWENPDDGEMMFSLLWYYRPEHTEQGRTQFDTEDEVFASRHRDANSVACIEDKCYILTFNEYCRFRKNLRRVEEGLESPGLIVPPGDQVYPRECRQPPIPVPSDMVLFCRRVYDYRGKKLVKNPG